MDLKPPERQPTDGTVIVRRVGKGQSHIELLEGRPGQLDASLIVSEYNAWRLFGALALVLQIPMSRTIAKLIKLGQDAVAKVR